MSEYDWKKDGWVKVIIPVQHMFPNCQVRYKTKCKDMKTCTMEVIEHLDIPKEFFKGMPPPEDFKGW